MADSDLRGEATPVIQPSGGLTWSASCDRHKIADKSVYYKAMDFFSSVNNPSLSPRFREPFVI